MSLPRAARRKRWRWACAVGLLLAAVGLQSLAAAGPALVERYYSRALYPYIGRGLSWVSQFFGFSLAELLSVALFAGLAVGVVWQMRRLSLRRVKLKELLLSGLFNIIWLVGGIWLLFQLLWGLNYQRQPLAANLQLEQRPATVAELEVISRAIIAGINRSYQEARADITGDHSRLPLGQSQLYEVIESAYQQASLLSRTGSASLSGFGPPKPVLLSRLMSWAHISGVYSPFTGEPNYNAEQPACDLPAAIAHEKAHQRGFAREDEASFVAFLICINSSHPYVRYSGYLEGLQVAGALARLDPERYRQVIGELGTGPRADLKARASFWARYQGRVSEASRQVNHGYLKANRVQSGVRNYGEVTSLIVGYYLTRPGDETGMRRSNLDRLGQRQ